MFKPCKTCGTPYKNRDLRSAGYCSPKCFYASKNLYKSRVCNTCGKTFENRNPLKYCSSACFQKRILKRRERTCAQCSQVWVVEKPCLSRKFCSKRCEADAKRLPPISALCLGCGNTFTYRSMGGRKRTYCCLECSVSHRIGENHPCFRGNRRGYRGANWLRKAQLARDRDGLFCIGCGSSSNQKLSVDHIIPFRFAKEYDDHRDPNDIINLVSLCRKCHSRKTGAETAILRGDVIGFISAAKAIIPLERILAAIEFWGMGNRKEHQYGKSMTKPCPPKIC